MTVSVPSALANNRISRLILATAVLLACSVAQAQELKSYILAARRSGAIEIIDPESLVTIGRIHFPVPSKSTGLNGVHAGADAATLYVEGPIPNEANVGAAGGCCVLYSINLATLETRQVAGVPGTASRQAFVLSGGIIYPGVASADRGPRPPRRALDAYDSAQVKLLSGMWMDGRFFFLGANEEDGSNPRLWSVSPGAPDVGQGVSVEPFAKVPGCFSHPQPALVGAAGNLFLYEMFGWIGDRRTSCSGVAGGAWIVDPSSGSLLAHVAPNLYFSELVADPEEGELYGISVGDPNWRSGIELVRIDAQDGTILQSRVLENDFWRIAFAPLRNPPAADLRALIYTKKK